MIIRWIHFVAGVTWIGLLWFFNWVNGPFMAALDAETKNKVIPQLMPRTLWWFRWGAAFTWISGVTYAWILGSNDMSPDVQGSVMKWFHASARGNWIGLGFVYGTIMAFNVWFVIWPRQKKIIMSTVKGENPPEKAQWAKVATNASRINTYLSLPLLFAMGAAKHAGELGGAMSTNFALSAGLITVIGFAVAWLFIHKVGPAVGKGLTG
ncbi:MAG: urate hydroxylase PuuD [Planctomycetota bacterium]|jgi:uncharacterized membrane protein